MSAGAPSASVLRLGLETHSDPIALGVPDSSWVSCPSEFQAREASTDNIRASGTQKASRARNPGRLTEPRAVIRSGSKAGPRGTHPGSVLGSLSPHKCLILWFYGLRKS